MDNQAVQKIKDLLADDQGVGIVVGKNQSLDSMGAALALYLGLQSIGKKVTVASPVEPLVEVSSLVGIQKVGSDLGGDGGDLVVSFPYREKQNDRGEMESEIQKVSYTLENGYLNIVVKASSDGLSFTEKDVVYKKGGSVPHTLFIIGTPRLSDLGTLFDPQNLKDTRVINIDNKSENQGFGDVVLVSPDFSSVSEQVASLLTSLNVEIDRDIAQNLLTGLTQGTDNFQKPTTSYVAFETAAMLLRKGAQRMRTPRPRNTVEDPYISSLSAPKAPSLGNSRMPQQRPQGGFPRFNPTSQLGQGRGAQSRFPNPLTQRMNRPTPPMMPANMGGAKTTPEEDDTPPDWLAPKVYKGSSEI